MLLALAEHADDDGYCFPGLQRLASMCGVSESTAHRMIRSLVSRDLITIERRFNKNGSCRSNGYRLAIADHPVKLAGRGVTLTGGVVSPTTGAGVTCDRVTTTKPVLYKELLPPANRSLAVRVRSVARRDARALCFPTLVSEAQRRALEAQLAVLTQHDAQRV